MHPNDLPQLRTAALDSIRSVLQLVIRGADQSPRRSFQSARVGRVQKPALLLDSVAEFNFEQKFRNYGGGLFSSVRVFGEESLDDPNFDLSQERGDVALIDPIDGSDLLERRLSNWCSAVIFFTPKARPGERIIGAFVGTPDREVFFSTIDEEGTWVQKSLRSDPEPVRGTSGVQSIEQASVCCYGQKASALRALLECSLISTLEARQTRLESKLATRIYTLAGIPMMTRLVHASPYGGSIDAVFELRGQQAHDVIPGAFLALRAGATMLGLDGRPLTIPDLEEALLRPGSEGTRLSYVLAATPELADDLLDALQG